MMVTEVTVVSRKIQLTIGSGALGTPICRMRHYLSEASIKSVAVSYCVRRMWDSRKEVAVGS